MRTICISALLLACIGCSTAPETTQLNVLDFGAAEGTDITPALQAALDSCWASGGGRVSVPEGHYYCHTFYLRDNIDLHLEEGAWLQGVEDPDAYSPYIPDKDLSRFDSGGGTANANCAADRQWMKAMVIGAGVSGASISGSGTLDGSHVFDVRGEESMRGPHTVIVACSPGFRMEGIHITRASNYAFLGYDLQAPVFENLDISEGWDGIHIRGASDARIRGCRFRTGDDSIAGGYWNNMLIENCDINSSCNGLRLIMPADGLEVRDCRFHGPGEFPHRTSGELRRCNMLFGIVLEPGAWGRAEGPVKNVYLHGLTMENLDAAFSTSVREGCSGEDLLIENVTASGLYGSRTPIVSWNDLGFRDIRIKDFKMQN